MLGAVAAGAQHGFAVARLLGPDGEVGQVYAVARPAVYRAIERLIGGGLLEPRAVEAGDRGPRRTLLGLTVSGWEVLDGWLRAPVRHVREIRTAFLVKLVLLERAGVDPAPLIRSQVEAISPVVDAIAERHRATEGSGRAVSLWRLRSAQATLAFLEELAAERTS